MADATAVTAGRGWWDLSGIYNTTVAAYPLVLDLVHDAKGKVTGTGTYTVAKDAPVTATAKGTVKGTNGSVVVKVAIKGTNPERTVSVSLALNLTMGIPAHELTGTMAGSVAVNWARLGPVTDRPRRNVVVHHVLQRIPALTAVPPRKGRSPRVSA